MWEFPAWLARGAALPMPEIPPVVRTDPTYLVPVGFSLAAYNDGAQIDIVDGRPRAFLGIGPDLVVDSIVAQLDVPLGETNPGGHFPNGKWDDTGSKAVVELRVYQDDELEPILMASIPIYERGVWNTFDVLSEPKVSLPLFVKAYLRWPAQDNPEIRGRVRVHGTAYLVGTTIAEREKDDVA